MNIFRLVGDMTHLASVLVLLLKIHTIKSCAGVSLKTQELYATVFATRYLDIFTDYISLYNTVMKLIFLGSSFSIVWYIRHHKIVRRSYDKDQDTFRHYFLVLPCLLLALVMHEKFTFKEVMWAFSLYLEAVAILPQLVLLQRTRNIDNLTGQYVFLLGGDDEEEEEEESVVEERGTEFSEVINTRSQSSEIDNNRVAEDTMMIKPNNNNPLPELRSDHDFLHLLIEAAKLISGDFIDSRAYGSASATQLQYDYDYEEYLDDSEGSIPGRGVQWVIMGDPLAKKQAWISGLVQTLLYADFFYYYFQSWKNNVKLELPA
ncbi:unnamed protein product [Camellia sinensis]